jgi:hypothetical protein
MERHLMFGSVARSRHRAGTVTGGVVVVLFAAAVVSPSASARVSSAPGADPAGHALVAHTILRGAGLGLSKPDDVTRIGNRLFVAFQNGVPSAGGTPGTTPTESTVVEFDTTGKVFQRLQLTGKVDGMTADAEHHRLIATVNEDGNSSLYTLGVDGKAGVAHYTYDANPLPHGGGTDSITLSQDQIYIAASAPAAGTFGPAVYQVTLADGVAHLAAAPFYDSSTAALANTGGGNKTVSLALTDPDSSTVVPPDSPRFAGALELTSQGDQQQIFATHPGTDEQKLQVLNITQSVNDTAWSTAGAGALVATDSTNDAVVLITGTFSSGTAYTAVTPAGANNAPPAPGPNYLGSINLNTGTVTPVSTTGDNVQPGGLIFLPANKTDHRDNRQHGHQ